ncbi:MAG: thioredoxin domain-containing protein [Candidatus Thorarchaeota archaeon]|nr:thioredoxin domain-containing protein [Candidatus Thorarchaeota archaeon]
MKQTEKERRTNRLALEKSPYLLQHATNPVDWYPWNDEAFERAKKENKPIFLSIGYSTCHWCHVMAHESFEDDEVAGIMNDTFVNIKVDREERPDIDGVYMQVAQMTTGRGGWPLTIIMTPDKKPFFAGTYIPKKTRYDTIGMLDLIPRISQLWGQDQENISEVTKRIETALAGTTASEAGTDLKEDAIQEAFSQFSQRYDEKNGGFGTAPKFPSPHNLMFLLRYWKRSDDAWALKMVEHTLIEMRKGGIFDHVGFGFHRYSTDANWMLPHFEKMLYDQASLMAIYAEVYQITKNPLFKQVVLEIYEYLTRDLMHKDGVFYSAVDADSEGVEGKFYVWTQQELKEILEPNEYELAINLFNIKEEGNFRDEATGEETRQNIPYLRTDVQDLVKAMKINPEEARERVEIVRQKMFKKRETRIHPHTDEKILADWNGYMISSLAKAGAILNNQKLVETAEKAMNFVLENLRDDRGNLFHRYREGETAHRAFLDDYAYLVMGLIDLYEATFKPLYLKLAKTLNQDMLDHFWDEKEGGLFFTGTYSEELIVRRKDAYDGAIPSGNSIAMSNLIRLARLLGDSELEDRAIEISRVFSNDINRMHSAYSMMLLALDFMIGPSFEIVIAGKPENKDTQNMIDAIRDRFIPRKVILLRGTPELSKSITQLAPFSKYHEPIQGKATAHVCVDHNCRLPTTDVQQMLVLLGEE